MEIKLVKNMKNINIKQHGTVEIIFDCPIHNVTI